MYVYFRKSLTLSRQPEKLTGLIDVITTLVAVFALIALHTIFVPIHMQKKSYLPQDK
jgi:hypothetical protein